MSSFTTSSSLPVQADLRYLLNLKSGHSVGVLNMGAGLLTALELDGLNVIDLAVAPERVDAIFLAAPFQSGLDVLLRQYTRVLAPGGQALLCLPNRWGIKRIKNFFSRRDGRGYSLADARYAARQAGLVVRSVYGLYDSLKEPRFFVPLTQPGAVRYFFDVMLVPYSPAMFRFLRLAFWILMLRLDSVLFADLCLVLERPC